MQRVHEDLVSSALQNVNIDNIHTVWTLNLFIVCEIFYFRLCQLSVKL